MTAPSVPLADRVLPARLMLTGTWLWALATCYALIARPWLGSHLPPRDQWGAAEEETAQLDGLVMGFTGFLIIVLGAAAALAWAWATHRLRQGSSSAPVVVCLTALGTAVLAFHGSTTVFPGPLDTRALAALAPLLLISLAAPAATLRAWSRHARTRG
ncbi:hypothetical protein ACFVXG_28660 [Kitasatospora sp. NPDC058162]|uniref:hypothetical protein n=1 Tax=Kitasatospora sp. NPDC058162 TaxID=3346362 RepID=UPI0036D92366